MAIEFTDLIIPFVVAGILVFGLIQGVDVFGEFIEGARENLKVGVDILPALIALMTCVGMFSASGALDIITSALTPLTERLGFPSEVVPLAILRPISGSGAIALYEHLLTEVSPDSFAGRVASVLLGSTETTFYTLAVYFSVTKVKKTRQTLIASCSADLTGFIFSALVVRLMFGG